VGFLMLGNDVGGASLRRSDARMGHAVSSSERRHRERGSPAVQHRVGFGYLHSFGVGHLLSPVLLPVVAPVVFSVLLAHSRMKARFFLDNPLVF